MRYNPQFPGDASMNAIAITRALNVINENPGIDYITVDLYDNPVKMEKGALEILKRYYESEDILFRSDYIATTLWCDEDIRVRLQDLGYEGTDEEVEAVLGTGYLKYLGDCTDGDWQQIDDAINAALKKESVA